MLKACPLSELAPGEALRLDTAPPIIESNEAPNLPPGLSPHGHL